jgi:4-hydroxy-3-methylbut-2-enyl diphosphate reductase
MKQFEIPAFYRSPIISKVKAFRKSQDPRKKDFTPTKLDFGNLNLWIPRHFGFCYGVENAIERAYKAIDENKGKRIFLLSQMIHNPGVNEDLIANGIRFLQDTSGKQLIDWTELSKEDIVIIPAFGTTVEIENRLKDIGLDIDKYDTTCPFVEKVWNRAEKLGNEQHTLIIHGKYDHEETRATFSHATENAPALIVKNMYEAQVLAEVIKGTKSKDDFFSYFTGKYSEGFDPEVHLQKMGVINQTTMLATETQEIAEFLKLTTESIQGKSFSDTRDTLCYATNDNQSATIGLLDLELDFAIVVGGYNSSNTTHLVELLEDKCPTYFIKDETEINVDGSINSFDIHSNTLNKVERWLENKANLSIAITSGASCPDSTVDRVIEKITKLVTVSKSIEDVILELESE